MVIIGATKVEVWDLTCAIYFFNGLGWEIYKSMMGDIYVYIIIVDEIKHHEFINIYFEKERWKKYIETANTHRLSAISGAQLSIINIQCVINHHMLLQYLRTFCSIIFFFTAMTVMHIKVSLDSELPTVKLLKCHGVTLQLYLLRRNSNLLTINWLCV